MPTSSGSSSWLWYWGPWILGFGFVFVTAFGGDIYRFVKASAELFYYLFAECLNRAQRVCVFVGLLIVLSAVLYPEFQTTYHVWVRGRWVEVREFTRREFVLNGRHDAITKTNAYLEPDLKPLTAELDWNGTVVEKRTRIKIGNVVLQTSASMLIALAAVWVLKPDEG